MNEETIRKVAENGGDIATAIILSEELNDDPRPVVDESESLFFLEERGRTTSAQFTPRSDETNPQNRDKPLPIKGRGRLDTFLVVAQSTSFSIRVAVDNNDVVDDSFTDLEAISDELTHVSAYTNLDDKSIVVVSNYPFMERLGMRIRPQGEVTFDRVRVEGIVE